MLVRNAMQTSTVTIGAQESLPQAVTTMQTLGVRRLLVLSGKALVGLLTDGALARALPHLSDQRTPWEFLVLAGNLKVSEVMRREVFTARPDDDLHRAISVMLERHVGGLPVLYEDGTLVGILTLTDVLRAAVPGPGSIPSDWDVSDWDAATLGTVREHMSGEAVTVSPDLPLSEAAARLVITRLRVLPVTQGRTLLGVLHQHDVRAAAAREQVAHGAVVHGPSFMEDHFLLQNRTLQNCTVRDLMCPPGAEVHADAPLSEAIRAMLQADVHGLPVVGGGVVGGSVVGGSQREFLGVITISDIFRVLLTRGQTGTLPTDQGANGTEQEPSSDRDTPQPASPLQPTVPPTTGGD